MDSELLPYYERELVFIRKIAAEFATQYPDRASALKLSHTGDADPHVERIIEAFALIAGRIQHRLDQEFPEITGSLLELLYPHLIRPVPSMAIVQFSMDAGISSQAGLFIPRGAMLSSRQVHNVRCRFRTAFPTRLWPLNVASAAFGNSADLAPGLGDQASRHAIRIEIEVLGDNRPAGLALTDLRFRIGGDAQAAHWMYEVLFNNVRQIFLRPLGRDGKPEQGGKGRTAILGPGAIRPVGFHRDEALLPAEETSFQGYRLLQEYFSYPQKFLFFDLTGMDNVPCEALAGRFEIIVLLDCIEHRNRALLLEMATGRETFQLGCTPAINLFAVTADPIRLSHTKTEYEVIPDVYSPEGFEVYSVDRVVSVAPDASESKEYQPFYSYRQEVQDTDGPEAYWFGFRRDAKRAGDSATDYFLSLTDRNFKVCRPAQEAITVYATCSNRDLPAALGLDGTWGELDLDSGVLVRARVLHGPTRVHRSNFSGCRQWRLISHLSLNHLSLVEGGVNALRQILRLHDTAQTHATSAQIEGLANVRSSRKIARLNSPHGFVFASGVAVEVEMDEDKFAGGGGYLLASVLERFLGLYCALNSFTQLRVSTRQRRGIVWQWPIRSGELAVV